MNNYTIFLLNENVKTYRYITLFILLINCIAFGYIFFNSNVRRTEDLSRFGLLLSLVYITLYFVKHYTKYFSRYKLEVAFIVIGVLWLVMGNIAFALILFLCAAAALFTVRQQKVIFTNDKIIYPSFPQKIYSWNEISNIILKDDVLTIDLKNNKLHQSTISGESASSINEKNFNSFCKERLSS